MQVLVVMASVHEVAADSRLLRISDRAAVHWGQRLAGANCAVRCPEHDRLAFQYSTAAGANCSAWREEPIAAHDLVLMGSAAIEAWGDAFAGRLAERFSAELLFDVLHITRLEETWRVLCDAGRGGRARLEIAGPVVAVVSDLAERPPYVSRYRMMRAAHRRPQMEDVAAQHHAWQPAVPRPPRIVQSSTSVAERRADAAFGIESAGQASPSRQVIADNPVLCAQVLFRYLAHHGFISRSLPGIIDPVISGSEPAQHPSVERRAVAAGSVELTSRIRRGPRTNHETEARIARRPRCVALAASPSGPKAEARLQRGPRVLSSRSAAGQRGPFRLTPDA